MSKPSAERINRQLFDKVAAIKLNDAAAIFGTTSKESLLQGLHSSVARLGEALADKQNYEQIMERYEVVAGNIDTAAVTGLISESELTDYYALVDHLWAAIEREKDAK